jgi:hypothetical protein
MTTAIEWGTFGPEDVAKMRSCLDKVWDCLPPERRTNENKELLAAAIVRLATHAERDPVRLSERALRSAMTSEASNGAL